MPNNFNFTSVNPPEGERLIPRLNVTIGEVTIDDGNGLFIPSANLSSIFTDYVCNQRFEQDRHVYMLPIASPTGFGGNTAAFVQLAAPTLLRIVDWTAARLNQQPVVPDPQSLDPDWILLDVLPETAMITVAVDGVTPLYRISGTHVYGHRRPSDFAYNNVTYARPPWLRDQFEFGRKMPLGNFQANLIDEIATGSVGGSVGAGAGGTFNPGGGSLGGGIGGSVGGGAGGNFG